MILWPDAAPVGTVLLALVDSSRIRVASLQCCKKAHVVNLFGGSFATDCFGGFGQVEIDGRPALCTRLEWCESQNPEDRPCAD